MKLPDWVEKEEVTILSLASGTGAMGMPTETYTPSGVTFRAHWQPVSAADAIKAGRAAGKRVREIWTEDPNAATVDLNSVLLLDGIQWLVVAEEKWPGEPAYFMLEGMS